MNWYLAKIGDQDTTLVHDELPFNRTTAHTAQHFSNAEIKPKQLNHFTKCINYTSTWIRNVFTF